MKPYNQKTSLGCGTLILIALIVLIFSHSGGDVEDLERQVSQLDSHVLRLTDDIAELKSVSQRQTDLLAEIKSAGRFGQSQVATPPRGSPDSPARHSAPRFGGDRA
jgi:Tfp pilus assembly protein PilN